MRTSEDHGGVGGGAGVQDVVVAVGFAPGSRNCPGESVETDSESRMYWSLKSREGRVHMMAAEAEVEAEPAPVTSGDRFDVTGKVSGLLDLDQVEIKVVYSTPSAMPRMGPSR